MTNLYFIQNNASYYITCKTTDIMKSVITYQENERLCQLLLQLTITLFFVISYFSWTLYFGNKMLNIHYNSIDAISCILIVGYFFLSIKVKHLTSKKQVTRKTNPEKPKVKILFRWNFKCIKHIIFINIAG
jgi:hypothetical protein